MKKANITLSGGGANGAFQGGFITAIYEKGLRFESATGVSAGALNAALIAQGKVYAMRDIWTKDAVGMLDITSPFRAAYRLITGKDSLATPTRLMSIIDEYITDEPVDLLPTYVLVVNANSGEKVLVDSKFNTLEFFKKYLLASSSVPGVLPPVSIYGDDFIDGGVRDSIFLSESDDIAVSCRNNYDYDSREKGIIGQIVRAEEIRRDEGTKEDIKLGVYSPDLIKPEQALPKSWDFREKSLIESFDHGYDLGLNYDISKWLG